MTAETAEAEGWLSQKTLKELAECHAQAKEAIDEFRATAAKIQAEIDKRLADAAKRALAESGREHGVVNLELQDGLMAKCTIEKKVEWDTPKLIEVAQTMPWDRVQKLFKIVFAVPERVYEGIEAVDPVLKMAIDKARTVRHSEPKITLSAA